ncbi:MAG: hypothetical protein AB7K09_14200 [Planctomycetota bacterium]
MAKLEFTHDKSDQVGLALKNPAKTIAADLPMPVLLWFPLVLLGLTAMDYLMLFFNEPFADRFFKGDTTISLLGGIFFALMYGGAAAGVFMRRRWSVGVIFGALFLEFVFLFSIVCGGEYDTFMTVRVPLMDAMGEVNLFGQTIMSGTLFYIRDGVFAALAILTWFLTE